MIRRAATDAPRWRKDTTLFECIDKPNEKTPALHAGIYKIEGRLTAVNRPKEENESQFLKKDEITGKLPGIAPRVIDGESISDSTDRTEVWSFFLIVCLVLLLGEAFLGQPPVAKEDKTLPGNA